MKGRSMKDQMAHPLSLFRYCPACGAEGFAERNEKAKACANCGFIYYLNPSAATACFIYDSEGRLLAVRRAKDPAKGTLDLPGGFMDMHETAEECIVREVEEETGLKLNSVRFLFSLPNTYRYSGLDVPTCDLFFEAHVPSFDGARADDDASELVYKLPKDFYSEEFGLDSIRRAVWMKHDEIARCYSLGATPPQSSKEGEQ